MKEKSKKTNSLIHEKSPYLLQHAHNPVNWHAWSDTVFEKAYNENKPVFLSIGYSTCHWCHVMEEESFNDAEVGDILNAHFIAVKVDREERPDIDAVYMRACQMMTGSGGWPLTIIMTPGKKPFFAATYIPRQFKYGRPGLIELLNKVAVLWQKDQQTLTDSSESITALLTQIPAQDQKQFLTRSLLDQAYTHFTRCFDKKHGGFGTRPKFPAPQNLLFLLRYYSSYSLPQALEIVEKTLLGMRKGGLYDHIGGGFFRYSTDQTWFVPHFEKMLYDQALLVITYLEAYQITRKNIYKETVQEILEYVQRTLLSPEGAFYTAEDADSEGEEGKFYLFSHQEIEQLLGEEAKYFNCHYSVTKEGNYHAEISGKATQKNIFHWKRNLSETARKFGICEDYLKSILFHSKVKLFSHREKRIHPFKDDKILTDWNGLAIAAFAKAGFVLANAAYIEIAKKAADFFLAHNQNEIYHRYRQSEWGIKGFLSDYSFLTWGLLSLYETCGEVKYLQKAIQLTDYMQSHFLDLEKGGFFLTSHQGEKLLMRQKEFYEGALPSGNSVALLNLIILSRLTGNPDYERLTRLLMEGIPAPIRENPFTSPFLLGALDYMQNKSHEIVIVTRDNHETIRPILEIIARTYLPHKIIMVITPQNRDYYQKIAPFTKKMPLIEGDFTLYVCSGLSCAKPLTCLNQVKSFFKTLS